MAGARRRGDLGNPQFYKIDRELHRELGLKPWHENVLDITIDMEPPDYLKDQDAIDDWFYVRELRRQLVSRT